MSEQNEHRPSLPVALANTAMDTGRTALSAAAAGAKTGARLAMGTFFAGCHLLLDLGVRAARHLPIEGRDTTADHLPRGESPVPPLGWWTPEGASPMAGDEALTAALHDVTRPLRIVGHQGRVAVARAGRCVMGDDAGASDESLPLLAFVAALDPQMLGDAAFRKAHGLKYSYAAGAMANGIGSEEVVEAMGRAGMLGFFGAAGLDVQRVERAIDRIQKNLAGLPYGFNLIHSPAEPALEAAVVDLYLRRKIHLVDASAYLDLTLPLVKYCVAGIARDAGGRIVCPNRVIAKVSRAEVARKFMSPPPDAMLEGLVKSGHITSEQAALAKMVPVSTDLTIEADSGGHTDNRPAVALIPSMLALRDEMQKKYSYAEPLRIGAAGGMATPASVAAAFSMGAAYVMTGSVNQACVEAGTSAVVKEMLAHAGPADVAMAAAADMFEMGVKVQVLKWGTMFATRAQKLYALYRSCASLEEIPAKDRAALEKDYFRCTLEQAWEETKRFFEQRDPSQISRGEAEPKHKMALVFRSYLGRSSDWANKGDATRKADYQIWCGPAMGAFNEWTKGTFLEKPERRDVVSVAMNLMWGAAVVLRAQGLKSQGIMLPAGAEQPRPMASDEIARILGCK
jgi:PfaD family protein